MLNTTQHSTALHYEGSLCPNARNIHTVCTNTKLIATSRFLRLRVLSAQDTVTSPSFLLLTRGMSSPLKMDQPSFLSPAFLPVFLFFHPALFTFQHTSLCKKIFNLFFAYSLIAFLPLLVCQPLVLSAPNNAWNIASV